MTEFTKGIKKGIPIALGYLSVSFTFGVKAANGGMPVWAAVAMSLTNLTSAGQFAGTNLILGGGTYLEVAAATFIINLRYMLMSLSLSQKMREGTGVRSRLLFGFGITDEVFAVASAESGSIGAPYMYGLIATPIFGWTLGTFLGAAASALMPDPLARAMELGLYAMFIAIILPPAKKSRPVLFVIGLSVALSSVMYYMPAFHWISSGFQVIIATVIAAAVAALVFPVEEPPEETVQEE